MAISKIQGVRTGTGTTSAAATYLSTPTAGNLLLAFATSNTNNTSNASITDWTLAQSVQSGSTTYGGLWYKVAGASESTTVTVNWASSAATDIAIYEFSEVNTLDKIAKTDNTGGVTSKSSGTTATTTQAVELWFACFKTGATTNQSFSNSFTDDYSPDAGLGIAYKVVSSTGDAETTMSWTTTRVAGGLIATFYQAAAGPSVPVFMNQYRRRRN